LRRAAEAASRNILSGPLDESPRRAARGDSYLTASDPPRSATGDDVSAGLPVFAVRADVRTPDDVKTFVSCGLRFWQIMVSSRHHVGSIVVGLTSRSASENMGPFVVGSVERPFDFQSSEQKRYVDGRHSINVALRSPRQRMARREKLNPLLAVTAAIE